MRTNNSHRMVWPNPCLIVLPEPLQRMIGQRATLQYCRLLTASVELDMHVADISCTYKQPRSPC